MTLIADFLLSFQNCMFHSNIASDLKAFTDKFGFDVLILLARSQSEEQQQPRQQVAVYSENLELCSQICCELEECQNPCLELEPFECGCDDILVYQQENPSVTCDQVVLLVKEVINRRCPEMVSNSRTSSTEAVAGSAPLSQGSSGIMELYGSDIEPQPNSVNFVENPPDLNDSNQAQVDVNIDLVSPDSGLATIRSSRSSKESSVFLSDDSPVGEGAGPHHNLLPGFDSYSPIPEGVVAEEHARSGEHSEHFDLFNFDPAPMVSGQSQPSSHSADYSPADDFFPNSDSSEGQPPTCPKGLERMGIDMSNYSSSSLLSGDGKDSLGEFDEEFAQRQESPRDDSERNLNLADFMGDEPTSPERLKNIGKRIPPTPMNSFVERSPSTEEPALLYPDDTTQKAVNTGHLAPPQTRTRCSSWWGGLEMDSKNIADAWGSGEQESVFQSPESWKDHKSSSVERRASESVFQPKGFEFSKSDPWDSEFGQPGLGSNNIQNQNEEKLQFQNLPTEKSHLSNASPQGTNHLIEDFATLWPSNRSPTAMPESWGNPTDDAEPAAAPPFPAWGGFSKEDGEALKNTWNLHPTSNETPSVRDLNEWAMTKSGFSFPAEDLVGNSPSEADTEGVPQIWGKTNHDSTDNILISRNPTSDLEHTWNTSKSAKEDQDGLVDPEIRGKVDSWNLFEESNKKGGSNGLAPWEDSFLSYKCSDYSASNIGEDSVPSPLDTNYSTSDSYTSPTFGGDEKEIENKTFDKEGGFESKEANSTAEEREIPPQPPQQPPRNRISSDPGNLKMWAPHHTEGHSESNAAPDPDEGLLKTESADDKSASVGDDPVESSQSSYDDPNMMQLYNETNRQLTLLHSSTSTRQAAPDGIDLWNGVILEDTQSTATISDMDNDLDWDDCSGGVAIPGEGQAQGYVADGSEPETRFSVKQLEPWGVEYQEANQADWELPTSSEHSKGDSAPSEHRTLSEKSGQLIANSIWDSVMRENNMPSLMLPDPLHVTAVPQSSSLPETPSSPEKVKESHLPDVLETSGVSESGALIPDHHKQDTSRGTLMSNTSSVVTTPENPGNFACPDPWKDPSYEQSEVETESHGVAERERLGEAEVLDGVLEISGKGQDGQEHSPLAASEHQEICNELGKVSSLSVTSSPQSEKPQEVLEQEESFNSDHCDVQIEESTNHLQVQETCENHLTNHRNSRETTEISGRLNLTKNISSPELNLGKTEECDILESERMTQESSHECPQSPNVWGDPIDNDVQVNCTGFEITNNFEVKRTENNSPGANLSANYDRDSISSECTHSSASTPDLKDSLAALSSWGHEPNAEHQENQDNINKQDHQESEHITTDGQEITEMKDLEKDCMDRFEKSLDLKVPKFLEVWNDSIDGDSLSSLSSPEVGKYSEYSGTHGEKNLVVSHPVKTVCDSTETSQPEDAKLISTNSSFDEYSVGLGEGKVEKEIHLTTCEVAQPESRAWDSLSESDKFLPTAGPRPVESSDYADSSEPAENKSTPFCDNQESSPEGWNFSPLKTEMQMTVVNKERQSSPEAEKNGDTLWQVSPKTEPKNENYSKLEMLGFSTESTEWWNASPQEGRPIESAFEGELSNPSDMSEMNSSAYQKMGPWGVPIQGDTDSMATHCVSPFSDKHQSPFLDSDGEGSHKQLWNIQPREPDPEADQLSQLVILDQIKEKDSREQVSISPAAGDALTSETPTQEQCQNTVQSVWDQPEPTLTHTNENGCIISNVSTIESQEAIWWEQEKSYPSEITNSRVASDDFPDVNSSNQFIDKSSCQWDDSTPSEESQDTFVPDILHQEGGQLASASPDLWMEVKQPFSLEGNDENPDILTHCDHDTNSQTSSSPDICHDYEVKQESEQHIDARVNPERESNTLYLSEQKKSEEPNQESGQEFVPYYSELYSENEIPLPSICDQANTNGSSQPVSPESSPEPSEIKSENNIGLQGQEKGADIAVAPVLEPVELTVPVAENMGISILVTHQEPIMDFNSSYISEDFSPECQTDAEGLLGGVQPFALENPTLLVSEACLDVSEGALDHSFSTSTGTIDDMSKLTLSEGNLEMLADGDAGKQDICSSEASWGEFEYDVMGQNIDEDLMKEPEHFVYGGEPPLEEDALKQSLTPYTPPFDLSYLTEPALGEKMTEASEVPEDECLQSKAAEMVLSAHPDQRSKEDVTDTKNGQSGHQLVVLHIHEDPETVSLPEGADSNTELSPSNIDWEIETENSDSPAGGDIEPQNGASKEILQLEEEKIIPTKEPEQIEPEYGKERHIEENEDHHDLHMDYILVNHEENLSPTPEAGEAKESTSELEEFHRGSEETELPEAQLASFPDSCQVASLNESKDHSADTMSSTNDKRPSLESPGKDQTWMVVGHSEVGDPSSTKAKDSGPGEAGETVEPASDLSLDKGPRVQILGELKPPEALALEEASDLDSQSRKSKNRGRAGSDVVMLHAVTHDNEWEMLSPQPSQKNIIPEMEREEETEFLESRIRKPQPNG
ncbi:Protein prune-2 [Galemys pyrenaicus]|uniref:Protein prune-2 n=1 Tax=Galemys pyrenaicus TaxID=202257 RepID=A0A8J6AJC0_GALPY|nr:Protein prune-2 [Galemys pyrenaicus]